MSTASQISW